MEKPAKRLKIVKRLDAALLLSPEGLPQVKKQAPKIHLKGKGHAREDLQKLMTYYQLWVHNLVPSLSFETAIQRCEKICKEKHMKIYLESCLSEERRRKLGISVPSEDEESLDYQEEEENGVDIHEQEHMISMMEAMAAMDSDE